MNALGTNPMDLKHCLAGSLDPDNGKFSLQLFVVVLIALLVCSFC